MALISNTHFNESILGRYEHKEAGIFITFTLDGDVINYSHGAVGFGAVKTDTKPKNEVADIIDSLVLTGFEKVDEVPLSEVKIDTTVTDWLTGVIR